MELISSILEAATNGNKKTRIMYRARLNFKQMQKYLPLLVERGLLENVKLGNGISYKITKKGLEFSRKFEELREL